MPIDRSTKTCGTWRISGGRSASSDQYCSVLRPTLEIAYCGQLDGVTSSPKRRQRHSTCIHSTTLYRFASSSCSINQADSYRRRERGVLAFKDKGDSLRYLALSQDVARLTLRDTSHHSPPMDA